MSAELCVFLVFLSVMYVVGKWIGKLELTSELIQAIAENKPAIMLNKTQYKLVKLQDNE